MTVLWVSLGLPLLFAAKPIAHIGRAAVDRIRAWADPRPPQSGEESPKEADLTAKAPVPGCGLLI
jgi:hypothetical protein